MYQLLQAIFGLRGVYLASNSLHGLKNDYAHVATQRILKKFIGMKWVYGLAVMLSFPRFD